MAGSAAAKRAWKERNPAAEKQWTQTLSGRLSRVYTLMQCRCRTLMTGSPNHFGLPIITRDEFYEWATTTMLSYIALWKDWKSADYSRKLTPTVDRIDPRKGYVLDNIEWVTQGENSRRNLVARWGAV